MNRKGLLMMTQIVKSMWFTLMKGVFSNRSGRSHPQHAKRKSEAVSLKHLQSGLGSMRFEEQSAALFS
jgi:hypothetical protein